MARQRTARQVELLDRLVDLVAAEGFAGFTLDDLAARMRCSKTTLYALADSKQELVVEVVKQFFRASVPQVEARVAGARDPADRVVAYLEAVADYLRPLSRAFMDDLSGFAPAAEVYRVNTAAATQRIRELIAEGIEAGAFREVNAAFAAEMAASTMFGIQRGEMFARLEISDAEAYAELASLLVHALTP
ncbi:TetR/AcrR family transcriptional regulator [Nocardioides donggukensis]|uniref:TetR/AcrR family transcriptional regulator n=1 Tax=Nocardioides donggukensis TaxID=2774019 RepID=A0A927Q019_9ACTN|nr:TetR family transcriptional regulator [Nocardioides donggukensis]MBD8868352.1 TetR/AcrR family transcriptional regulator [Nocardioides donggukensis]